MIPIAAHLDGATPAIEWLDLGDTDFSAPFFTQTIARYVKDNPNAARTRTALDGLSQVARDHHSIPPTGFIFHMSKCGSTLVSRMLAALPDNLVLSEPDPINDVLGPAWNTVDAGAKKEMTALLIAALGRPRRPAQTRYFIKFSSWNALFLPLAVGAHKALPKLFIYRDPVEVMVSVLKDPPGWMDLKGDPVAAGFLTGYAPRMIAQMSAEEYCARILARFLKSVLVRLDSTWMLLNYRELPGAMASRVMPFFGLSVSPVAIEAMRALETVHAKDPTGTRSFSGDSAAKQSAASTAIKDAAEQWLAEPFQRLEEKRNAVLAV
jgi:hypothetical protein